MVHTYKHYAGGGMGLRTILDVYLYLRKNKELDFSYVEKELGKLNIVSKNNLDEISFKNKMKILLKKYGF